MEGKVYLVLYVCGFIRGVYFELFLSLEISKFFVSLKGFIVRCGCFCVIYLDNGSMFKVVVDWLRKVMKDEEFYIYFLKLDIVWRFNFS